MLAADGFVWTASVTGHLCKLDPTSGDVVAELDGVGAPITMAWGGGRIWVPTADGGIVLVDPAGPSIAATLAAAPPGEVDGGKYTLGTPDENARIVADDTGAWVRYSHGTMGRVDLAPDPHWTIYAGLKGAFMGDEQRRSTPSGSPTSRSCGSPHRHLDRRVGDGRGPHRTRSRV